SGNDAEHQDRGNEYPLGREESTAIIVPQTAGPTDMVIVPVLRHGPFLPSGLSSSGVISPHLPHSSMPNAEPNRTDLGLIICPDPSPGQANWKWDRTEGSPHGWVKGRQPVGGDAGGGQGGQGPVPQRLPHQTGPLPAARRDE